MKLFTAILILVTLVACSQQEPVESSIVVEERIVKIPRPAPIVPLISPLNLRDVKWIVINEENIQYIIKQNDVLFALTADGYQNLSLNLSDIRSLIQQQQEIIAIYEQQFQ